MSDNTAKGFLDDILANPDDDAPRLIFADWLEDQGQAARAEFIRAQVERAKLPDWDVRHVRLLKREWDLLLKHRKKWEAELPKIKGVTWGDFRRGFMATATFASFSTFEEKECWAAAPIEAVSVRWPRRGNDGEGIAPIAGLHELTITGNLVDVGDADRLAAAAILSTLRALTISEANLGLPGFAGLLDSPHLENLKALRLPYNSIGNGGINVLAEARLYSLEELDLSEEGSYGRYGEDPIIDSSGMAELADWEGLDQLRSLTLSGNDVRDEGFQALMESEHLTALKTLVLRGNSLTGDGIEAFGEAPSALKLDVLDLGENLLREVGASHLAEAACLSELKVLNVDRCEIRANGAKKLAKAAFMETLRRLNANHNSFGSKGLSALLDASPPELHYLGLLDNDLDDDGPAVLAISPDSDNLLEVNLSNNELSDEAAKALAASNRLKNLLILRLKGNPISKEGAAALAASPLGKRLDVLELPKAAR